MSSRKVLIVGGSRGIGGAIAARFITNADEVLIVSRRPIAFFEQDYARLISTKSNLHSISLDLMDKTSSEKLLQELKVRNFIPNIVVFAIGGPGDHKTFNPDDYMNSLRFNFEIPTRITLALLPLMSNLEWARLVFIGSLVTKNGKSELPYVISKTAITTFAQQFNRYFYSSNGNFISFCVSPGPIAVRDKGLYRLRQQDISGMEDWLKENRVNARRIAEPMELAEFIFTLSSQDLTFHHGANFTFDGGGY